MQNLDDPSARFPVAGRLAVILHEDFVAVWGVPEIMGG